MIDVVSLPGAQYVNQMTCALAASGTSLWCGVVVLLCATFHICAQHYISSPDGEDIIAALLPGLQLCCQSSLHSTFTNDTE